MKKSKKDLFKVKLTRKAEKFLKRLSEKDRKRILNALRKLEDPITAGAEKVEGTEFHKIRVGKIRIVFYIDWDNKIVAVFRIDKRERIYDRL